MAILDTAQTTICRRPKCVLVVDLERIHASGSQSLVGSEGCADLTVPEPHNSPAPGSHPNAAIDGIGGKGIGERSSNSQLVPRYLFDYSAIAQVRQPMFALCDPQISRAVPGHCVQVDQRRIGHTVNA